MIELYGGNFEVADIESFKNGIIEVNKKTKDKLFSDTDLAGYIFGDSMTKYLINTMGEEQFANFMMHTFLGGDSSLRKTGRYTGASVTNDVDENGIWDGHITITLVKSDGGTDTVIMSDELNTEKHIISQSVAY